jgi:hypothetical protein
MNFLASGSANQRLAEFDGEVLKGSRKGHSEEIGGQV